MPQDPNYLIAIQHRARRAPRPPSMATSPRTDMARVPLALPTARKRLLLAALNQRQPSPELIAAVNELLHTLGHPLALKVERGVAA